MKIRAKLLILLFASISSAILTVATYFFMVSPIEAIQTEQKKFVSLLTTSQQVQIELNRLDIETFGTQIVAFQKSIDAFNAAIEELDKAVVLPTLNEEIFNAVEGVKRLNALFDPALAAIKTQFEDIQKDSLAILKSRENGTMFALYKQARESAEQEAFIASFHINKFQETAKNLQQLLSATSAGFVNTETQISAAIDEIRARSGTVSLLVSAIILILLIVVSMLVGQSIAKALSSIHGKIASMSTGDLRGRFDMKSRDEIGLVGKNLNALLEMLHDSIGHTKGVALENLHLKDSLAGSVDNATSSAVQIDANTDSIRGQVDNMDSMIQESGVEIKRLAGSAEHFDQKISSQNRHIEETVSAVTQMIASLENITRITERDRESAVALVRESESGREVFEDSFGKISSISERVGMIQEMASVIANVASQTNILAMNAAIEAAHAGEYGKGFAVVADEIGKLAAESAASSAEIAQSIRDIVDSVDEAASTREATVQAFDGIQERIKDVSDSISEIHQNIREMQIGSRQAIESMESLRSNSSSIVDESKKMDTGTRLLASSFADVTRISHEMASNISEIVLGLREINKAIHEVSGHAGRIGDLGKTLAESVDRFQTDESSKT